MVKETIDMDKYPPHRIIKELEIIRRKDLQNYYKYVLVCKGCKKEYGCNVNEKVKLCPVCTGEIGIGSKVNNKMKGGIN